MTRDETARFARELGTLLSVCSNRSLQNHDGSQESARVHLHSEGRHDSVDRMLDWLHLSLLRAFTSGYSLLESALPCLSTRSRPGCCVVRWQWQPEWNLKSRSRKRSSSDRDGALLNAVWFCVLPWSALWQCSAVVWLPGNGACPCEWRCRAIGAAQS